MRIYFILIMSVLVLVMFGCTPKKDITEKPDHVFNNAYTGEYLNHLGFPIGGIGAGMFCLDGRGSISHLSLRNKPDVFNEPLTFAAICVKGKENIARVLQGPIPEWKYFSQPKSGNGTGGPVYGLPRFASSSFSARFPFATIVLEDENIPLHVEITGWSPFIPNDADNSSLPAGVLEYLFVNKQSVDIEAVFSFNSENFVNVKKENQWGFENEPGGSITAIENGFILHQSALEDKPYYTGDCAVFIDDSAVVVDHCWFRGGWFDPLTTTWKTISSGETMSREPVEGSAPGASIFVPFTLKPGEEKNIKLMFAWYVPNTNIRFGNDPDTTSNKSAACVPGSACCPTTTYSPWYAGKFSSVREAANYWRTHFDELRENSALFRDTIYDTSLPDEVMEAVTANLTILKSPTVLRQTDGRLWCYEGCSDNIGCCNGSCTHVWNYAQALPHLFPALERTLRETEFNESQDESGHQQFRSSLPIRPAAHDFYAASDGQLGGIVKVYREWRISGDKEWMQSLWPKVKQSLDYCIQTWDPKGKGIIEEPHHNTYDIEFWGPNGFSASFYLGALTAAIKMGETLGEDVSHYKELYQNGRAYMENSLYNGEYFIQKIQWEGLEANDPVIAAKNSMGGYYSPEALELLKKEGPKYQYGNGCLSDGVLGLWIAKMAGIDDEIIDKELVYNHLKAVHKHNLKLDLSTFANPQRPSFAMGKDGGLLLCTWPDNDSPTLPFVYSNEVWTGIEYQAASHMMLAGLVNEGLEVVRVCRTRYNGITRNPFDEYECGHWYARAMSSYGLLQGLTGVRYDAVEKTLFIDSQVGKSFRSFLSTETGYATVGLEKGKPFVDVKYGIIDIKHVIVSGKEMQL